MTKLNEFLEQNQDYKIYIVNRIVDNIDIQTICDELNSFETNINFTIDELISYKNSCDLSCEINNANDNKNINDNEAVKFSVNFDDDLKLFKTKNLIEQNNHCNELLSEINYKLLYIINEKLNRYQDRVPKDDIQAFNKMASCQNIITANSSFSWWAGFLCPHLDRKITYPNLWFSDNIKRVGFPKDWIEIQV